MSTNVFVDYYELLQLSHNADIETIERLFRHLAKKFHPDNTQFADKDRFLQICEAHRVLSDPEARALRRQCHSRTPSFFAVRAATEKHETSRTG